MGIPIYTRPNPLAPERLRRFQRRYRRIPMIHYSSHDDNWARIELRCKYKNRTLYSLLQRSREYSITHYINPLHNHTFSTAPAALQDEQCAILYQFESCEQALGTVYGSTEFGRRPTPSMEENWCNYGGYQSE